MIRSYGIFTVLTFEIRIFKKSGIALVYKAALASAFAAIRRALSLADAEDGVEVWHGLQCVYSTSASA